MTTYNGEHFLREQLDSILAQSITDWELVICDDCSIDSSVKILTEYSEKDTRIKVYKNEKNIGLLANFSKAISLCTGDFVATSDQDDIWECNHLQLLLDTIGDDVASAGEALLVDQSGSSLHRYMTKNVSGYTIDVDSTRKLSHLLFCSNPFSGAVCLFRREVFDLALPIPQGVEYQDTWFTACALCMGSLNFTSTVITKHRLHAKNSSGAQNTKFLDRVKRTFFNEFGTDRIVYCDQLQNRFPNLSTEKKQAIVFAKVWLQNRLNKRKIKAVWMLLQNYKKMFATNSKLQLFFRCLQILIRN